MSQFSGSLGAFNSRSYVTSAANAGIAIAARLIDAKAASLPVVDMQLLPLPIVIGAIPAIRTAKLRTCRIGTGARPNQRSREIGSGYRSVPRGSGRDVSRGPDF